MKLKIEITDREFMRAARLSRKFGVPVETVARAGLTVLDDIDCENEKRIKDALAELGTLAPNTEGANGKPE